MILIVARVLFLLVLAWMLWRAHRALKRVEVNMKYLSEFNRKLIEENSALIAENAKLRAEVTIWTGKAP